MSDCQDRTSPSCRGDCEGARKLVVKVKVKVKVSSAIRMLASEK